MTLLANGGVASYTVYSICLLPPLERGVNSRAEIPPCPGYAVTLQVIFGPLQLPYLKSFWQCLFFLFRCEFRPNTFCKMHGDLHRALPIWLTTCIN